MDTPANVQSLRRLTWLAGGALLWAALILGKLFWLQVISHDQYTRMARQQQERVVEIPAQRGSIFDRNGRPLAISVAMESVFVNPRHVPDLQVAAGLFARLLSLDRGDLDDRMRQAYDDHRGFLWVKRKISRTEADRLRSLHLEWIGFQSENQRHYPKGQLAAHVLGSVDHDEKGNGGVEMALNGILRGQPGSEVMLSDVKRRGIDAQLSAEAHAGTPVTLTIDERIQFIAERELAKAVELHHSKTGTVVVMNPHTGEILALANFPTFDPNMPPKPNEDPARRFDLGVSVPFEPGSIFKVITLSAALETTDLRPESLINCGNGVLRLPGRIIHEAGRGHGTIPMSLVLAESSNIGAIQIGLKVGPKNMYEYVRRFGFGSTTGVPLPAESTGVFRKLNRWGTTSLASIAMGHEVTTTPVQLAQACSVIANGGLLIKPRIVVQPAGAAAETPQRVLRPETVTTMRRMMEGVVVLPTGTGRRARLEGYTSGGKTGTAQIFDIKTHHYTHAYNASFMGFAPVTNPAIVIVVTLNGTTGGKGAYGGPVAAPVFKAIATEALRLLDVPRDLPDAPTAEEQKQEAAEESDDLAIADLGSGEPNVVEEQAAGGEPVLTVADAAVPDGPTVPNFRGKTMRAVLEQAASMGLPLRPAGSGVARGQMPPPGSVLRPGERIRVQFSR